MAGRRQTQTRRTGVIPDVGLWHEIHLAFRLYRDPRVSSRLKSVVPVLAVLYVLSPIDLIPDFLLGLGQVDDLGVLGLAFFAGLRLIRRFAPSSVVDEHLNAMGLQPDGRRAPGARSESGEIIDTTFTVSNRSNRQATAGSGRRVG
jgi:uncharacterized membrane protein YkvA (DUF1232 family)